jgi:hypothetical protein
MAIERAGGKVWYDWQFKDGLRIANGNPWAPKWLVGLLGVHYFDNVTMVHYLPRKATDLDMAQLGNLSQIDTLVVDLTDVSDAGLAQLERLRNLRWLTISTHPPCSTDELLRRLKVLPHLRGLNLDRSDVTDAGLRHLKGLIHLELLGLEGTGLTDDDIIYLNGLTSLRHLYLDGTRISDKGLVDLEHLVNLKSLRLKGTSVSGSGVRSLQKALPHVRVSH